MKEKRTYSLTAKERKQRRAEAEKKQNKQIKSGGDAQSAEAAMLASQKTAKRNAVTVGAVLCVAIILVIAALLAPVIAYVVNPYAGYKDVIARFKLSNGMTLEYVIDEKQYDIAATNFIFLAKSGYFDNTVFYDASNGWLRFGGYEGVPNASAGLSSNYELTKHHSDNKDFCTKFTAIPNKPFEKNISDKFGYRFRADSGGTNNSLLNQAGILTFLYSDTSTEFQMSWKEQPTNEMRKAEGGYDVLEPTMVGHVLNEKTLENVIEIANTAVVNEKITSGYKWATPSPTIYIRKVSVYNLKGSKWRNFDFIEYADGKDKDNRNRLSQWIGRA
ncbi:MAG: hypothetical protein HFJ22_03390 [Clostridia bacterium]|nr:hypothetical protein [Clostridia bacterium]